jgi:alpha,alpha-trehalase
LQQRTAVRWFIVVAAEVGRRHDGAAVRGEAVTRGVVVADWLMGYDGRESEGVRETLCSLGNGYLATRGAKPERQADGTHYPGTYLAGCYNRLPDAMPGAAVENESLVNAPNWLPFTFRVADGPWFGDAGVVIVDERHELDLRQGVLLRRLRVRDSTGRATLVTQRRLVHLRLPHVCALQTTITPDGWSGRLVVRSTIDTAVQNRGVARYADLASQHLNPPERAGRIGPDTVLCVQTTNQSRVRIAMAARTRTGREGVEARREVTDAGHVGEELELSVEDGQPVTVEKVVCVYTSRDRAISAPEDNAAELLGRLGDFDDLFATHALAWRQVWGRYHIDLFGDHQGALRTVRLHVFHLLQTLSTHSVDADVGVPARGLHGA